MTLWSTMVKHTKDRASVRGCVVPLSIFKKWTSILLVCIALLLNIWFFLKNALPLHSSHCFYCKPYLGRLKSTKLWQCRRESFWQVFFSPAGFVPSAQTQMGSPQHLPAVLLLHHGITALSCSTWGEGKFHGRGAHFSLCFIVPELTFSILVSFSFHLLVLILWTQQWKKCVISGTKKGERTMKLLVFYKWMINNAQLST